MVVLDKIGRLYNIHYTEVIFEDKIWGGIILGGGILRQDQGLDDISELVFLDIRQELVFDDIIYTVVVVHNKEVFSDKARGLMYGYGILRQERGI